MLILLIKQERGSPRWQQQRALLWVIYIVEGRLARNPRCHTHHPQRSRVPKELLFYSGAQLPWVRRQGRSCTFIALTVCMNNICINIGKPAPSTFLSTFQLHYYALEKLIQENRWPRPIITFCNSRVYSTKCMLISYFNALPSFQSLYLFSWGDANKIAVREIFLNSNPPDPTFKNTKACES